MANPLAIALALYGGYKGYKAGKERGGGLGGIIGGVLGAAGGFYGGQALGSSIGLQNIGAAKGTALTSGKIAAGSTGTGTIAANSPFAAGQQGALQASRNMMLQKGAEQNLLQKGIGAFRGMTTGQQAATLGSLAGLGAYASGAFAPEPYKRMQFTYNVAYPELYRNRQFFVQDPVTGNVVEQEKLDYIPEENKKYVGEGSFGPYGYAMKTMNTGGLVEIAKFNEGGMPVKMTHDEKDPNNYKRTNGSVYDHTSGANKNEDTILAQLADGEFVTRTDGILGAGIVMGADPHDEKEMRKKGAEFFYDQQKKMKRLYDLFNGKKKTN